MVGMTENPQGVPESGTDLPRLFGDAPPPGNELVIDELTDKLIEKREKLDYFIVTAATAVIVFTFKDFNDPKGLLHTVSLWVPAAGWVVLLMASGCALFSLKRRHTLNSISLDWRYEGRKAPKDEHELKRINRNLHWVKVSDFLMGCLFVAGMALLGLGYSLALQQGK